MARRFVCCQIGIEKHRMLDLFIQVPAIIRKRLSRRCKEVYETVRAHVSAEEVDEGTQEQVIRHAGGWLCAQVAPTRVWLDEVRLYVMNLPWEIGRRSVACTTMGVHVIGANDQQNVLTQVAPLDLSGVDLSKPSGQKLRVEHRWTIFLILKLAVPVLISMVCGW